MILARFVLFFYSSSSSSSSFSFRCNFLWQMTLMAYVRSNVHFPVDLLTKSVICSWWCMTSIRSWLLAHTFSNHRLKSIKMYELISVCFMETIKSKPNRIVSTFPFQLDSIETFAMNEISLAKRICRKSFYLCYIECLFPFFFWFWLLLFGCFEKGKSCPTFATSKTIGNINARQILLTLYKWCYRISLFMA